MSQAATPGFVVPFLASREAFQAFVSAWKAGTLPKSEWTHAAHVAIGAYFAVEHPGSALERMRAGIRSYNDAVGTANTDTSGYHETLTRFWATRIAEAVSGRSDAYEAATHAVKQFGHARDLFKRYYSFDVVRSTPARRSWIPPDLNGDDESGSPPPEAS